MARKLEKKDLLKNVVKHIDIKKYDSTEISRSHHATPPAPPTF